VELPTYTSIWRIEKRLYKLYDFRLPMPLPVGQIAVFTAITVPYVVLLTIFGLPFNHTLFWLYVLPPGVLTWLATRPVLESKRLPELLISQARYLGEPSTWCRMAPLAEKDEIVVFGRVWRRAQAGSHILEPAEAAVPARSAQPVAGHARQPIAAASAQGAVGAAELARVRRVRALERPRARAVARPAGYPGTARAAGPVGYPETARDPGPAGQVPAWGAASAPVGYPETARDPGPAGQVPAWGAAPVPVGYPEVARDPGGPAWGTVVAVGYPEAAADPGPAAGQHRARDVAGPAARPRAGAPKHAAGDADPASQHRTAAVDASAIPQAFTDASGATQAPPDASAAAQGPPDASAATQGPADASAGAQAPADAGAATPAPAPRSTPPVLVVPAQRSVAGPPPAHPAPPRAAPVVERVLSGPGGQRAAGWRSHVTVVPGGRGPGRPDHEKEAKARALLPLDGARLVVVLGCTVGAGQTVTTLMLADLLASLRGEPVAALDLNPGPTSLSELARVPATTVSTVLAARSPGAHAAHPGHGGHASHAGNVMHRGGPRGRGRLDVICQDAAATASGAMTSLEHGRLIDILASRYPLTLADPGASAVAKILAAADQLVLVAPASADAIQAVSMTCEWLGAHGQAPLAEHSVALINGVSRRSAQHAEQTEFVLRGRCRAIVRVPWDDHLAEPGTERGIRDSLEPGRPSRLGRLHPAVLQAYTALAGVLVSALAADPAQRRAAR
jgi:MinD-like ATPase involved in chromosome partitioning or flagellar assembly